MDKLTIDSSLRDRLGGLQSGLELCDETGQTLGYFVPVVHDDPELYRRAAAQISDEELERRRREPGKRRTTQEVLERLEKMESP